MPWTAVRTAKCYGSVRFAIAQQLVYHAITVPTAVRNRVTKTMSVAPLLGERSANWAASWATEKDERLLVAERVSSCPLHKSSANCSVSCRPPMKTFM